MKISRATLRRLEKLEAAAPTGVGNWVIGLSGNLVWDAWDFPEPSAEEAAATLASLLRQMDQIAERMQGQTDYLPPSPEQTKEAKCALAEMCERMQAEKAAVRAFTAKIERERAARAAKTAA